MMTVLSELFYSTKVPRFHGTTPLCDTIDFLIFSQILTLLKQSRDQRESRKNLDLDNFSLISSNLGLDSHENFGLG